MFSITFAVECSVHVAFSARPLVKFFVSFIAAYFMFVLLVLVATLFKGFVCISMVHLIVLLMVHLVLVFVDSFVSAFVILFVVRIFLLFLV